CISSRLVCFEFRKDKASCSQANSSCYECCNVWRNETCCDQRSAHYELEEQYSECTFFKGSNSAIVMQNTESNDQTAECDEERTPPCHRTGFNRTQLQKNCIGSSQRTKHDTPRATEQCSNNR